MSRLFPHSSLTWLIKAVMGSRGEKGGAFYKFWNGEYWCSRNSYACSLSVWERELYLHGREKSVYFRLAALMPGAIRFKMRMTDFEKKYHWKQVLFKSLRAMIFGFCTVKQNEYPSSVSNKKWGKKMYLKRRHWLYKWRECIGDFMEQFCFSQCDKYQIWVLISSSSWFLFSFFSSHFHASYIELFFSSSFFFSVGAVPFLFSVVYLAL